MRRRGRTREYRERDEEDDRNSYDSSSVGWF